MINGNAFVTGYRVGRPHFRITKKSKAACV